MLGQDGRKLRDLWKGGFAFLGRQLAHVDVVRSGAHLDARVRVRAQIVHPRGVLRRSRVGPKDEHPAVEGQVDLGHASRQGAALDRYSRRATMLG